MTFLDNLPPTSPLPPPYATLFLSGTLGEQSKLWAPTKKQMRKGFRPNSLNMESSLLSPMLLIYLTMWYVHVFLYPGQDTLFIQYTNQEVALIWITTVLSWWVTDSPSSTSQSYTSGSLRRWTIDILGLEDMQVFAETIERLTTSSHFEPLLRRVVIALWRSIVAL